MGDPPEGQRKKYRDEIIAILGASGKFPVDVLDEVKKALSDDRTLATLTASVATASASVAPLVIERSEKYIISDAEVAKKYLRDQHPKPSGEGMTATEVSIQGDVIGQVSGGDITSSDANIDIGSVQRNVEEVFKYLQAQDEPGAEEIRETVETILEAKETSKLREHLRKFVEWAKPGIANASQTAFLALNELIRLVGPRL